MITINNKEPETIYIDNKEVSQIEINNDVVWTKTPPLDYFYIQNEYSGNNTFTLTVNGTLSPNDIEYSKDRYNWIEFDLSLPTTTISLDDGEKLYLRKSGLSTPSYSNYVNISCSESFSVGGDMTTFVDYSNDSITTLHDYQFFSLFKDATTLLYADSLDFSKITTLSEYSMSQLFMGCSSLVSTPDLIFNNYGRYGISSIFRDCTSLVNPANFGNQTKYTGRSVFYQTFFGCSSLQTPPNFSNLTLVDYSSSDFTFQYTFYNCTSLQYGPDFSGLTSIQPPMISGSAGLFANCFNGCSSITDIIAPNISTWSVDTFKDWVKNVSASGVLHKNNGTSIPTGDSGVPSGWTTSNYSNI